MEIKYPNVHIDLVGEDGNAFSIMGRLRGALRSANIDKDDIKEVLDECTAGDYNHLLQTVMTTVSTD